MQPSDLMASDPMMRIVRERHPNVNIVLLPPLEPILDRPSATAAQCRAFQQHAETVLATLARHLDSATSTRADHWWSQGHPEVRRWVTAARFGDLECEPVAAPRSLATLLSGLGWDPRPAADGSPRFRGEAGPFELIASAEGDAVSISITSEPVFVSAAVRDQLDEVGA